MRITEGNDPLNVEAGIRGMFADYNENQALLKANTIPKGTRVYKDPKTDEYSKSKYKYSGYGTVYDIIPYNGMLAYQIKWDCGTRGGYTKDQFEVVDEAPIDECQCSAAFQKMAPAKNAKVVNFSNKKTLGKKDKYNKLGEKKTESYLRGYDAKIAGEKHRNPYNESVGRDFVLWERGYIQAGIDLNS